MHQSQSTTFKNILWVVYLAIALVFIQGARLHVHAYSHNPATSDHAHQDQAHFDYDASEKGHSDEVVQIDLSQQALLKNLTLGSLVIALFAAVVMFLPLRLCTQVPWRLNRRAPLVSWPFSLRPPLRAPPL